MNTLKFMIELLATLPTFSDISDFLTKKIIKGSCSICSLWQITISQILSAIGLMQIKVSRRDQKWPHLFHKFLCLSDKKMIWRSFKSLTGLQIPFMQRFWKIRNSMLQLRTMCCAHLPVATNCQWRFSTGYRVSRS